MRSPSSISYWKYENGLYVSITSAEKATTSTEVDGLGHRQDHEQDRRNWDAGDSVCELPFGPEGAARIDEKPAESLPLTRRWVTGRLEP